MKLELSQKETRQDLFAQVEGFLEREGLKIQARDLERPWGGFFVIDEDQAADFARLFFPELTFSGLSAKGRLSPKILMVEPGKKLSWQYHHRRSEIWKSIYGRIGVVTSPTDEHGPIRVVGEGEPIELSNGERHRLVGLETWGVVAEIWMHSDSSAPSDENDIVRVEDEFGR
jgi:mannose-6-phosphate isomerase